MGSELGVLAGINTKRKHVSIRLYTLADSLVNKESLVGEFQVGARSFVLLSRKIKESNALEITYFLVPTKTNPSQFSSSIESVYKCKRLKKQTVISKRFPSGRLFLVSE